MRCHFLLTIFRLFPPMPSIVFKMPLHRNNTLMSEPGAAVTQQIGVVLQRTVVLAITMTRLRDEAV